MRPKMHSLSLAFAMSASSVTFSSYYKFLKVPFWLLVSAAAILEAGKHSGANAQSNSVDGNTCT